MNDHAVAHDRDHVAVKDARRHHVQLVDVAIERDGVARVVAASVSGDDIGRSRQPIDHPSLALIAPLRPD